MNQKRRNILVPPPFTTFIMNLTLYYRNGMIFNFSAYKITGLFPAAYNGYLTQQAYLVGSIIAVLVESA